MSEYTSVYLRKKTDPLLSFRDDPTGEELDGKNEEEVKTIYEAVRNYNKTVCESSITPIRNAMN